MRQIPKLSSLLEHRGLQANSMPISKSCGWLKNHQTYWSDGPGVGVSCVWESRIESKKQSRVIGERKGKQKCGQFRHLMNFSMSGSLGKLRPRNKNRMNVLSTHTYILVPHFQNWTDRLADSDNNLFIHLHFYLIQPHKRGGGREMSGLQSAQIQGLHICIKNVAKLKPEHLLKNLPKIFLVMVKWWLVIGWL